MASKWKVLIVSIVVYQIILTLVVLKQAHYGQQLYFRDSVVPLGGEWYEGNVTLPLQASLVLLGVILFILITNNGIVFWNAAKINNETKND